MGTTGFFKQTRFRFPASAVFRQGAFFPGFPVRVMGAEIHGVHPGSRPEQFPVHFSGNGGKFPNVHLSTCQGRLVGNQQAKPPCLVDPCNRFDAAGNETESLRCQDRPGFLVDHPVTVDQNCTQFFRFFHRSWLSSIFRSSFGLSASSSTLAKKFFHSRPSFSKSLRNPSVSRW